MEAESHHEPIMGRCPPGFKYDEERDKCDGNEITNLNGNVCLCFFSMLLYICELFCEWLELDLCFLVI